MRSGNSKTSQNDTGFILFYCLLCWLACLTWCLHVAKLMWLLPETGIDVRTHSVILTASFEASSRFDASNRFPHFCVLTGELCWLSPV